MQVYQSVGSNQPEINWQKKSRRRIVRDEEVKYGEKYRERERNMEREKDGDGDSCGGEKDGDGNRYGEEERWKREEGVGRINRSVPRESRVTIHDPL